MTTNFLIALLFVGSAFIVPPVYLCYYTCIAVIFQTTTVSELVHLGNVTDFARTSLYASNMQVRRTFSGAPWEKTISYCRAIQIGLFVAVSGTTSMKDGSVFAPGDAGAQTQRCLEIIEAALKELGLSRSNIIRTRMFVTDISRWEEFGTAHGEFFRDHPPAASMYEVSALINPDLLIEIEVDAIAHDLAD